MARLAYRATTPPRRNETESEPTSGIRGRKNTPFVPQAYLFDDGDETDIGAHISQLARLGDPNAVPHLTRYIVPDDDLTPEEAYVTSLFDEGMTVPMVCELSPLSEDEVVRLLARLVMQGLVTVG